MTRADRREGELIGAQRSYRYTMRRSQRAKHLLLHVDAERGIEVVVPRRASWREAMQFVQTKQAWIEKTVQKYERFRQERVRRTLESGVRLPLLDEQVQLTVHIEPDRKRRRIMMDETGVVLAVAAHAQVRPAVEQWYYAQAQDFFTGVVARDTAQLGVRARKVAVRSFRTQWGSCSPRGVLAFNWRLMLGPSFVARYVGAHEVAHLRHPNHSARFWQAVAELDADHARARQWLRRYAHTLVL